MWMYGEHSTHQTIAVWCTTHSDILLYNTFSFPFVPLSEWVGPHRREIWSSCSHSPRCLSVCFRMRTCAVACKISPANNVSVDEFASAPISTPVKRNYDIQCISFPNWGWHVFKAGLVLYNNTLPQLQCSDSYSVMVNVAQIGNICLWHVDIVRMSFHLRTYCFKQRLVHQTLGIWFVFDNYYTALLG